MPGSRGSAPDPAARADSVRHSYTPADVEFMKGMIRHHAQALVMARMAPTRGANASVRVLAERIINGQNDEIALMRRWLRDRNESVPEPVPASVDMAMHGEGQPMHGGGHPIHMPGMLSEEQLEELDAARGATFDRLFLTYMIQHHQGALTMVNELFSTYAAGRGEVVFKLASDIGADQASEIARMQSMLRKMLFENVSSP
ncbi:MAG: DUF305 domain-containing protein [Gemmatimonadetes bacterium]|nr:DUF305 domain-containing protein [Gemmatimonadota bacterium]